LGILGFLNDSEKEVKAVLSSSGRGKAKGGIGSPEYVVFSSKVWVYAIADCFRASPSETKASAPNVTQLPRAD